MINNDCCFVCAPHFEDIIPQSNNVASTVINILLGFSFEEISVSVVTDFPVCVRLWQLTLFVVTNQLFFYLFHSNYILFLFLEDFVLGKAYWTAFIGLHELITMT